VLLKSDGFTVHVLIYMYKWQLSTPTPTLSPVTIDIDAIWQQ